MQISDYISIVNQRYQARNATEHSYRGDLQQLLQTLLPDVDITNEPKRIDCGAPDYILSRRAVPVGYIEAKDIGVELGHKAHKEQFDRYKAALDNLIITDYLQFHFYKQGQLVASCYIGEISNGKIHANPQNFDQFTNLMQNFAIQITQSIKSPTKLAQMMASKAKLMADVIHKSLNEDDKNKTQSELKNQFNAFKTVLMHDINNAEFADIYAQTIAYGMFAARYHDPTLQNFSREEAARLIPQSNPFLRQLFRTVAGYNLDDADGQRLLWIVEELVQIFLATDVASIMRNFGRATRQQDPVVHFYETFLAEYDPKLRKARGVWYTPEPVVDFIVRAVDDLLKTKFNLHLGLGDTSKTQIKVEVKGAGKKGETVAVEKEIHKVQILDPATGTGTFLAQVVRHIYSTQFSAMQGVWPQYVKEHLIPRLNGFELLMTSYAMAHLKLDMLLTETGAYATTPPSTPLKGTTPSLRATPSKEGELAAGFIPLQNEGVDLRSKDGVVKTAQDRLRIYLTNSLENDDAPDLPLFNFLSAEANEANRIKRDAPVMVVMGNPPYSGESANKGDWIMDLMEDYKKEPGGKVKLKERNPKWINDDYVKFLRFGQHFIEKNGEGILAFINPHGFLDNPTFRGMRWSLLNTYDEIYVLDLHGNSKKKETAPDGSADINVFDIMQGVSINLFVKTGLKKAGELAEVKHYDLYGKRERKYDFLINNSIKTVPYVKIDNVAPSYYFVQKDFGAQKIYDAGFSLNELFPINSVGIVTANDPILINSSKVELSKNIAAHYGIEPNQKLISKISYRVFDDKYIYYDDNLVERTRKKIMTNYIEPHNLGLICKKGGIETLSPPIFITKNISEFRYWSRSGMQGGDYSLPLYTYPDSNDLLAETTRTPNLNMQIVETIAQGLGLTFTAEKATTPSLSATPSTTPPSAPLLKKGNWEFKAVIPLQNEGVDLQSKDGVVGVAQSDGIVGKLNDLPYNPALKEKARELRKAGNLSEVLFWNAVKSKQLDGLDFDRQRVIGNYIVDFYCHEYALVLEIDGSSHDDKQEYDAARDAFLKGLGLNVLHVQDIDVKKNLAGVIELVKQNTTTPPSTPLHFEGELLSLPHSPSLEGVSKAG